MNKINKLRTEIDKIDTEILKLLNKRSKVVYYIGKAKKSKNLFRPERQANILKKLFSLKFNKISPKTIFSYWRSIFFSQINIQGGIDVIVLKSAKKKEIFCIYDYFSHEVDIIKCNNVQSAYKKIISTENSILIMPYPTSKGEGLWWTKYKFSSTCIIATLPFLINKKQKPILVVISKYMPSIEESNHFLYISKSQVKNKNMLLEAKGINRFLYKSNVAIDNPNLQLIGVLSKSYEA